MDKLIEKLYKEFKGTNIVRNGQPLSGNYCYQESRFRLFGLWNRRVALHARKHWLKSSSRHVAASVEFRRLS